tara:strand:- start:1102 stop:2595 length:1494 start_codon:yes stop_codon:yes gene_type:complete
VTRASLTLLLIAILCAFVADIEVTTLDPWGELGRMAWGALTPDASVLYTFRNALLNTVTFAFCGISLGIVAGGLLSAGFQLTPVRLFCGFIRAIHEIFWAFLFLPVVGLNPVCGILAIGIPYAGVFAKVYSEIWQEADRRPLRGLPATASGLSRFLYGLLPLTLPALRNYTSYRFECALRSSAVLGFIGLPTLGFHLETAFREGLYSEAAILMYAFYLLIGSLRYWVKPRLIPLYVLLSIGLTSTAIRLSWANLTRFFSYEILPWPIRRQGFVDGSGDLSLPVDQTWTWLVTRFTDQALPGIYDTAILTQIALAATGLLTLLALPSICRHFASPLVSRLSHYVLIVARTTPEYILAYIFVQLWGPSLLPAIAAIALHNGAILAYLSGQHADRIQLRLDAPGRRADRYGFEVLPRIYGQLLAFLFYRWEIMMRESAILGILGITTLGFFIDSAIAEDKMDQFVLLLLVTAFLNMGIDSLSQRLRKGLHISIGSVKTVE